MTTTPGEPGRALGAPPKADAPARLPAAAPDRPVVVVNASGPAPADREDWTALVGVLTWPVLIAFVAVLFGRPLSDLIDRLRSFKGGGVEISAEDMIRDELPTPDPEQHVEPLDASAHPVETVIVGWAKVEKAAKAAVMRCLPVVAGGSRSAPQSTALRNVEALERAGRLRDPSVRPVVNDLQKIRDRIVHRPDERISAAALQRFALNAAWARPSWTASGRSSRPPGRRSARVYAARRWLRRLTAPVRHRRPTRASC